MLAPGEAQGARRILGAVEALRLLLLGRPRSVCIDDAFVIGASAVVRLDWAPVLVDIHLHGVPLMRSGMLRSVGAAGSHGGIGVGAGGILLVVPYARTKCRPGRSRQVVVGVGLGSSVGSGRCWCRGW